MALFLLQIVHTAEPHKVVRLPAGGALERDLIADCTKAIVKRGVGVFRTEAHVMQAIADGITEAINSLKQASVPAVGGKK